MLGYIMAGTPISAIEDVLGYEEISLELASTGSFFCLKVKESSMEPRLFEDDIIIVKQQPDVESGEIAVVLVNGDEATIKQIKKADNGITLIGYNVAVYPPTFYSNEDIINLPVTIIGKVIELRRYF
nr:S24 family peptidase [Veillonella sp. R32]